MTDRAIEAAAEKSFAASALHLNYLDYPSSSADPLVLLHGGAWCWQEYLALIPSLAQRHHVYALDLRGNGRSEWTPGRYALRDFAQDVVDFLARLDRPAVLVGHSIGGAIALMAAARRGDKVSDLIIEDAPLSLATYRSVVDSSRDMYLRWLALRKAARSEADLALRLADTYGMYSGATSTWLLFFAGCLWRLDPTFFDVLLSDFDSFVEGYDPEEIFSRLSCPVLFLRGDVALGAVAADEELAWLRTHFPVATIRTIAGVGHLLHLETHGQAPVLAEMLAFLARVQGG